MSGKPLAAADLGALNDALAGRPVVRRLEPGPGGWDVAQVTTARGLAAVIGSVAESFAATLAAGEPERVKVCANADCGWFIYDESRSRTRRWCEASECGNLIKVRRFRARRRAAGPPPGPALRPGRPVAAKSRRGERSR